MRRDEMEHEILVFRAKRLEVVVGFYVGQRAQLVSIAIEEVEVDRPLRLRVGATIDRCFERALPPRRALSFVMKTSRQSEEIRAGLLDTKTLSDLSRAVFGPALVLIELLRTIGPINAMLCRVAGTMPASENS